MNITFVVLGLLTIVGMLATRRIWPRRLLARIGSSMVVLSGLGAVVAGLSPEDVQPMLHIVAAILGIGVGALGVVLLGFSIWPGERRLAISSIVLGGLGLFGFFIAPALGVPTGAAERIASYPTPIWEIILGVLLVLRAGVGNVGRRAPDGSAAAEDNVVRNQQSAV
jgi:hypothetical membrane protein